MMAKRRNWIAVVSIVSIAAGVAGSAILWRWYADQSRPTGRHLSLRLQWTPQAQFCGYIVAQQLGYYRDEGISVDIRPAGPELKPHLTVAAGTDDIGIGVANQVITARSNGVPLTIIAQIFQDSANRYVLKRQNAVQSLSDLRGRRVGLWTGGDEAEFAAMLHSEGLTMNDVQLVPQGFEVTPFLRDEYVLSQVTVYNELNLLRQHGLQDAELQILSPRAYGAAIVSDMVFTSDRVLRERRRDLVRFLAASLRGWRYCVENQTASVRQLLAYDPSLNAREQEAQLREVSHLVVSGGAATGGIGAMSAADYTMAQQVLLTSSQMNREVPISSVYDASLWREVSVEDKVARPAGEGDGGSR